jgi:mannose-6-phosphate isomerase
LHQTQPEIYKDANHKPEMAIALTKFEALCGFRPITEIEYFLRSIPELQTVIGENKIAQFNSNNEKELTTALKNCFTSLLTQYAEIISQEQRKLVKRLSSLGIII